MENNEIIVEIKGGQGSGKTVFSDLVSGFLEQNFGYTIEEKTEGEVVLKRTMKFNKSYTIRMKEIQK